MGEGLRVKIFILVNLGIIKFFLCCLVTGLWVLIRLAEANRTPFDFAEGESELASGFNIEYGSVMFALIFMAEYASIIFIRIIFSIFFISYRTNRFILYIFSTIMIRVWI